MPEERTVVRRIQRDEFMLLLTEHLPDVRHALPPGTIEAERLEVAFRSAFNKTPKLAECSKMSICNALVNCASLGLIPNTPEQHCYLIPRRNADKVMECNLEIGYRGFAHMILRTGNVSFIDSDVIYKGDEFTLEKGKPVWVKPDLETPGRQSRPVIAAYCEIVFKDGTRKLEYMDADELAKIERAMMRQNFEKASPAWREWKSQMQRKAPVKRIAKTCDFGPCVARAAELDNAAFARLPSAGPKPLILPGGETMTALPRHEPKTTEEPAVEPARPLDPQNAEGEFEWEADQ